MASRKRKIKESYDNLGGRLYDIRYEEEQVRKYEIMLAEVEVKMHEITLDDGCGTGLLFDHLDTAIVGLDISSSLLTNALSRTRGAFDRHLIQGDAENLPLRDHVFSLVFAVTLIQNTPNQVRSLKEVSRVGCEGATIIVTALKKAFSAESFMGIIQKAGYTIVSLLIDERLSDYIAILSLKIY